MSPTFMSKGFVTKWSHLSLLLQPQSVLFQMQRTHSPGAESYKGTNNSDAKKEDGEWVEFQSTIQAGWLDCCYLPTLSGRRGSAGLTLGIQKTFAMCLQPARSTKIQQQLPPLKNSIFWHVEQSLIFPGTQSHPEKCCNSPSNKCTGKWHFACAIQGCT